MKNVLLLTLSLILSMLPITGFANETASISIESYIMVVEGFDWGPGVTYLILTLDASVEEVNAEDFTVAFYRSPSFRMNPDVEADPILQEAVVVNAFIGEADNIVVLAIEVHPGTGVNPFTFTLSPMGNDWSSVFDAVITWNDEDFMPERTQKIIPIVDDFDLSGRFVYDEITLQYASFAPPSASTSDRPLIIWLHGGGEGSIGNTAGPEAALLGNRVTQLAAPEIQGFMGGAHVLVPQTPTAWMSGADFQGDGGYSSVYESALMALIDDFIANTPTVDTNRIYIGGCSNGGYMVMRLLFERPNMFAAAWPICLGYRETWITDEKIERIAHVPIWFIHDYYDPVGATPHEDSERLLSLLLDAGAENVHLFTSRGLFSHEFYDEDGNPWQFDYHWSWIPPLNNTVSTMIDGQSISLFEWMAAQTLAVSQPAIPQRIVDGTVYVPFRLFAYAQGAEVGWDVDTNAVLITIDGYTRSFLVSETGGFNDNGTVFIPYEFAYSIF